MAITEAQRRAHDKYFSKAYKQVKLAMPNDEAEALEKYCSEHGYTKAGFIRRAIIEAMAREDTAGGMEIGAGGGGSPENSREK